MTAVAHTTSYYASSANTKSLRPMLTESLETDVCILGAGYSGLSSALHLAEAGFKVIVLEGARVGWGASGRNGGQIVNGYSRDIDVIQKAYGKSETEGLVAMMFEGGDIIRQRIERYNIQCDLKHGGFFAACTSRHMKELEAMQQLWQACGNNETALYDAADMKQVVDSERYVGGLLDKKGGHIHPLNLSLGQADAIESLGGKVFEGSPVTHIDDTSQLVFTTPQGSVKARFGVICGNAYLGKLVPALAAKAMPCGTQIITTKPMGEERARQLMPADFCIEDNNYLMDYYRRTGDNRLLYGGGVNYGGGDPANFRAKVKRNMLKTFPQLADTDIEFAWSGDFLLTLSRVPQLGRIGEKLYYAQGYSGHGVTTSHLAGKLVAEALQGDAERFDSFARLPHYPFPGGRMFRVPFTALGAFWYSLRDRFGV